MMFKLSEDTLLMCPVCKEEALTIQWDAYTKSKCTTRQLRRSYKSLLEAGALAKKSDRNYCCPYCDKFSKSHMLKIVDVNIDNLDTGL